MNLDPLYRLIRRFEGLRLKPYRCPAGVPTVGYGHTGPDVTMQSPPITPAVAEHLMREDAHRFVREALKLSPILATEPGALCAIADFCYNLGSARYKASTLRRCINRGDWDGAAEQLQKWVWGGGRKLPGLVARRRAEAALLP
jgi:lysozyme